MTLNYHHLSSLCFLCLTVVIVGCGGGGPEKPATYPVSGTVTMKDEPVADANVRFQPDGSGWIVNAKTDAAGKYQLEAVEGPHLVGISKIEEPDSSTTTTSADSDEEETPSAEEPPPVRHLTPEVFANPQSSGLTAEVKSEGENVIDFDLSDPPKAGGDGQSNSSDSACQ